MVRTTRRPRYGSPVHESTADADVRLRKEWFDLLRQTAKTGLARGGVLDPVIAVKRRMLPHLNAVQDVPGPYQIPQGVKVVRTVEEADAMLAHFDEAFATSDDAAREAFRQYHMVLDADLPDDPFSPEYRQRILDLYEWMHGKPYAPTNEVTELDIDSALRTPVPYLTRSTATVGQHLMIVGHAIRSMDLPPDSKVLEFGPGWGNIAEALSRMGHEMTVVDIEPHFLELIRRRIELAGRSITTVQGDFGTVTELEEQFDAVVFFECFHHCLDHVQLLQELQRVVKPGGRIYLAAEPVNDAFPFPWGPRLDGESVWAIRRNGWLELGFQERYLFDALERTGWEGRRVSFDEMPFASVYVVERPGEASTD